MKLSELLQLDMRIKENKQKLIEKLRELPFFEGEEINAKTLEKAINKMCNKYPIHLGYIMHAQSNDYWSAMIKETTEHKCIKTIYGLDITEVFAKATLFIFAYIKSNFRGK